MGLRRLLYLSARGLSAWRWHRGALEHEEAFPPTETGEQRFADYLARNRKSSFSLLANLAEEGFHLETIPHLRGADRRKVIERRLAQTFHGASLIAAASLGREKGRREEERLLLAAFTSPALFEPWLDAIAGADAALAGIHSLPFVAAPLLEKLRLPSEPCLLLSVQDQSLRQSFFDKGKLHFSRLTPLPQGGTDETGGIAQLLAAESGKLQQYLASQRLIGRDQTITARILAHPGAFHAIRSSCVDTQALRFKILDLSECARRVGLKTEPRDMCAETLFLHLLAAHPSGVQFAGEDLRHGFRIARTRSRLEGAGALILSACLLFSANALFDARRIARDAEVLAAETASARQRHADVVKTFPRVPLDHETLKRVIDRYLVEEGRGTAPIALYREISRALEAEAAVEIDRLDSMIGGAASDAPEPDDSGIDARQVPEDAESAVVRGTLRLGAQATPRQVLDAFGRFVDALRANASLQVEVFRQPFDLTSGASLRGGDDVREEEKPRNFGLRLTRRIAP